MLRVEQVLVFEGDSLTRRAMPPSADTWALLRLNNWDHSYAEIAEEWLFANLPHLRLKIRHCAVGGSGIRDLRGRYESQVKPLRPAWLIFSVGVNDAVRSLPLDEFRAELEAYVATALADQGTRCLYVGGFRVMPKLPRSEVDRLMTAQSYFEAARAIVRAHGGLAPDLGSALQRKAELHFEASPFHSHYSDGLHLSALGNAVLAGLVLQVLGAYAALPEVPAK